MSWRLHLNAAYILKWPFWLACNEQFHSMNESIVTWRSAWKIKRPQNITEADQGSKREGIYTTLDENYFSNNVCVIDVSFITNQRTAVSLHMKSASPETDVFRWVKNNILYNIIQFCVCGYFIFQDRCESQYVKIFVLNI